ncbi:MAG: 30S ribosomal protein S6 [Bacillota bacterium]
MRKYELLFITNAEYDEEKVASVTQRYQDVITRGNGVVKTSEKWGKRRLAYEINDQRDGLYILMTFEAERDVSAEIDRLMKIDQDVLRHMVTRLDHPRRKVNPKKAAQESKVEEPRVESAESAPAKVVREAAPEAAPQTEPVKAPKTGEIEQ